MLPLDRVLRLTVGIVAWTVLYVLVIRWLIGSNNNNSSNNNADDDQKRSSNPLLREREGYPLWSYILGMFSGGVAMPLLSAAAYLAASDTEASSLAIRTWTRHDVDFWGSAPASHMVLEQIHCAIIGYLLKDAVYSKGLSVPFILHHVASVGGCMMCLVFPTGATYVSLNAAQCEFASAFYNATIMMPGSHVWRLAYWLVMLGSNSFAMYLSYVQFAVLHNIHIAWRITYISLASLIVLLRCGGWVLNLKCAKPQPYDDVIAANAAANNNNNNNNNKDD
jgi:hypothetical protein